MPVPDPKPRRAFEDRALLVLVIAISIAFAWILSPFYQAVFWAAVLAILFTPMYRRIADSMRQRRSLAALASVAIIVVLVIMPLTLIALLLFQEGTGLYARFQSGAWDPGRWFRDVFAALPAWLTDILNRFGLTNFDLLRERLAAGLTRSSKFFASRALDIGQNAFEFIVGLFLMLYLLFFLLRDGEALVRRLGDAIPLHADQSRKLFAKFTVVTRATIKGNIVVAGVQGLLGGFIFWFLGVQPPLLWGAVMAILSLLPAIGAALVWVPAAIWFLATGAIWQGVVLIGFGALVISSVDNVLRPVLVGKETRMPDYVVLFSTLGGLAVFGPSGFVIGPVVAAMFIAAWDIFSKTRPRAKD